MMRFSLSSCAAAKRLKKTVWRSLLQGPGAFRRRAGDLKGHQVMVGVGVVGDAVAAEFGQAGFAVHAGSGAEQEHVLEQMGVAAGLLRFILAAEVDGQGHGRQRQVMLLLQKNLQAVVQGEVQRGGRLGGGAASRARPGPAPTRRP